MSHTISLEYYDLHIPQPDKTDVITIAAFPVENLQLQGGRDHLATCFCFTMLEILFFCAYEVHKGFIIVNDYSDQNCDTFFKIKRPGWMGL